MALPLPLIDVRHLGGLCPVQAEGTVDGHRFFFRARGARWRLWVAAQPGPFEDPMGPAAWLHEEPFGSWPDAGYMDQATAQSLIDRALNAWASQSLASRPAQSPPQGASA